VTSAGSCQIGLLGDFHCHYSVSCSKNHTIERRNSWAIQWCKGAQENFPHFLRKSRFMNLWQQNSNKENIFFFFLYLNQNIAVDRPPSKKKNQHQTKDEPTTDNKNLPCLQESFCRGFTPQEAHREEL